MTGDDAAGPVPGDGSPFLTTPPADWVASNELAFAVRDRFPVSEGHTLVVPRRLVADWFDATPEEQQALLALVQAVKDDLDAVLAPDGYNVGFNSGSAAGQTVFHLHVHVIPRYRGDVPNPRGGVRHVLPGGDYLSPAQRSLWDGPRHALGPALLDVVEDHPVDRFDAVVSFVLQSGLDLLEPLFDRVTDRDGRARLLVTDYLGITERAALERLARRNEEHPESFEARLFRAGTQSFHPKAYLLSASEEGRWAFVGSANASRSGLLHGVEWTLATREGPAWQESQAGFDLLWQDARAVRVDAEVVQAYREADRSSSPRPAVVVEPPSLPPTPHAVQQEALSALEDARSDGYRAGLVVMATGLGKTWLAAFDSSRPQFRRVLFVAHREEILRQARAVFRQVRPMASTAMAVGGARDLTADLVFASVQTLGRHLERVSPDAYDYVVVDEFHHAAAPTYRRLLGHLQPQFLLGLTATPDRPDQADLLALCEDNLVYDCGLAEGIERQLLTPFSYYGVPDPVDFRPLPWRNGRFDPEALENAVVSQQRTEAALREWRDRRGTRTLAFCVSQRHADWMAAAFREAGVRAVAVHTGPGAAPRHASLEELAAGELDVVCAVDLLNEGVDIPAVDTVLLLRPTSSPIVFLQQIGRGLRRAADKQQLTVIDFVGNHRSFLLAARTLADLVAPEGDLGRALRHDDFVLPEGCTVDYALEARERLLDLLPRHASALAEFLRSWAQEHGSRPTAAQAALVGRNPGSAKGGWFPLLDREGLLTPEEQIVVRRWESLLREVQTSSMTKSYKMVALRAWLLARPDLAGQAIPDNARAARQLVLRDPRLVEDVTNAELADVARVSDERWTRFWRTWPLDHLVGKGGFVYRDDVFSLAAPVPAEDAPVLSSLLHELVEWKLLAYLERRRRGARLRVSHSSGRPILRFDRGRDPGLPEGVVPVLADGVRLEAHFVKVALNVVREHEHGNNVLPDLLFGWFGQDAGRPGTAFEVELVREDVDWHLRPVRPGQAVESGTA